jgi:hypothetical protein
VRAAGGPAHHLVDQGQVRAGPLGVGDRVERAAAGRPDPAGPRRRSPPARPLLPPGPVDQALTGRGLHDHHAEDVDEFQVLVRSQQACVTWLAPGRAGIEPVPGPGAASNPSGRLDLRRCPSVEPPSPLP